MWGKIIVAAAVLFSTQFQPVHAGDSGWKSLRELRGIARSARARNEIPVSMDCKPGPGGAFAPKQVMRIVTKPNTEKRNWVIFATAQAFRPGESPSQWNDWRLVSSKKVSDPFTVCYLYHHKKPNTLTSGSPPLSKRTSSGWVSVN